MESGYKKSNAIADKFRIEGTKEFCSGKHFNALILNNLSLSNAETDDRKASAFANRSAVYFELKLYQKCLENIQLAQQHGYPVAKMKQLERREEKCRKAIETPQKGGNPSDYFQLSQPANVKIPFIINCLQSKSDSIFGRGIFTNRELKAGDIIAIEEPFVKFMKQDAKYNRCALCLKSNMLSLLPSPGSVMFCSEKCLNEGNSIFKDDLNCLAEDSKNCWPDRVLRFFKQSLAVTGSFEELRKIVEESKKETIFSFNLNKSTEADQKIHLLKCMFGLLEKKFNKVFDFSEMYQKVDQIEPTDDTKFLEKLVLKQTLNCQYNAISFKQHDRFKFNVIEDAAGIFPFSSLINHACFNNVHPIVVDNKLAWIVIRPVPKDSQIFANYGTNLSQSTSEKKKFLEEQFGIFCQCKYCEDGISLSTLKKLRDPRFKEPSTDFTTIQDAKLEIAGNWNYINNPKAKYHPSYEVNRLTTRNIFLLDCISGKMFSPA